MQIGLGLWLGTRQVGGFSPATLFAAGEPGGWYDPSDLSTMFQDSAGTTPVTATGQTVGLLLDKSQGLVLGPELVTNGGPFITTTGWTAFRSTLSVSGTSLRVTEDGTNSANYARQTITTVAGIWYYITATLTAISGPSKAQLWVGTSALAANLLLVDSITTPRTITARFLATSSSTVVELVQNGTAGGTTEFTEWNNISVKELAGNHLTQTTAASRPQYQIDANGLPYLLFDGTDDWFISPTITPGIDKAQVFAGVRKLRDTTQGAVVELSSSTALNNGAFLLAAPDADATATYGFDSKGTVQVDAVATGFATPVTSVVTGLADISGDSAIIRVNGVQANADTGDQGTGNFLAYPLYVGRRNTSPSMTLPFSGRMYQLIVRFGANLPAGTLIDAETFVNSKTGAYGVSSNWFYTTLGTPTDLSLTPVPVLRSGFDTAGSVVTRSRNVRLTKRVREAYPNQTTFTSNQTALEYKVYDSDTVSSKVASSEVSPKPIANWVMPSRLQVQSTVHWEILPFHQDACNLGTGGVGQQVASVRVRANNGTTATAWQTVSTTTPSTFVEGPNPVDVFQADLDVSGLADGTFWLEGEVFPWFGAAASVLKSEDQTAVREFSRRYFTKRATINYVYVSSTGNDTTGVVSSTAATALAAPCLTIAGALLRARTALGTTTVGALDGLRIRVLDGVNTGAAGIGPFGPLRQDVAGVIIERAPGVARSAAVVTLSSTLRPTFNDTSGTLPEGSLIFNDVSVVLGGAFTIGGEAVRKLDVQFWNCNLNWGSFATSLRNNSHLNFFGVAGSNFNSQAVAYTTSGQIRILRGLTADLNNGNYEGWVTVGCNLTRASSPLYENARVNGHITYNNKFLNPNPASTGPLTFAGQTAANNGLDLGSVAVVQNLVELLGTVGNSSMRIAGDSDKGNLTHAVVCHNTLTGVENAGRVNISYDEAPATARFHRNVMFKANLVPQINVKGDDFILISSRLGHFELYHGVNCSGNFTRNLNAAGGAANFGQGYPGIGSIIAGGDPLFVNNQSVTKPAAVYVAGAGGGDYNLQAGSPARGDQEYPLLKYDLAGNLRGTGAQHAGCYQTA